MKSTKLAGSVQLSGILKSKIKYDMVFDVGIWKNTGGAKEVGEGGRKEYYNFVKNDIPSSPLMPTSIKYINCK